MKPRKSTSHSWARPGRSLALAAVTFLSPAVQAQNTWIGNTDANWNTGANWSLGALTPGDSLVFGAAGTSGPVLNNTSDAGNSYAAVTFGASASHFTVAGNSITCGGNITVGTNSVQTINLDLALSASRTFTVDTGSSLNLGGVISGESFGVTKSGAGFLFLNGTNTYTGVTTVTTGTLFVPTLDNGGNPSSIGQSTNAAANLVLNGGTLRYTGPAVSTDRSFTLGGGASLEAFGSGALNLTNTATPGYGAAGAGRTLTLTGMNPGDNTLAAVLTNNGGGVVAVSKTGSGTWVLSGANTYTGTTTLGGVIPGNANSLIGAGTLVATTLADGGSPSSIGQASNAASTLLLGTGTTLKYIGSGHSTNRNFTINGDGNDNIGAALDASGSGAIHFTNSATPGYGTVNKTRTLILKGSSTETNTIAALLANNGTSAVSLLKTGIGTWSLVGAAANTYGGGTTVNGGTLIADFANLGTPTNLINTASALTFGGGTLAVEGKDGSASSQSFAGNPVFSTSGAGSGISVTGGSGSTADLVLTNTWTRNVGSTVNVTLGTGGTVTSSPATANGLVVGSANIAFATVGGSHWAKVNGTTLAAFATDDYTTPAFNGSTDSATGNYNISGSAAVSATEAINTIRIDTVGAGEALTVSEGQTLTLNAGGLLFVGAQDYNITGGTVKGSGGTQKDLVIHQFGAGALTVDSLIANNGAATALTKSGPGTLALTNANTFSGATAVGGGTLVLKNKLALQNSTLTPNGGSVVFDSSVAENAFTLGQLASTTSGPGYDIALQNNAATPITLTVGGNNTGTTYVGALSGPGSLVKAGTNTLTLSGSNSYTGTTTITGGTLSCGVAQLDSFLGTRPGGPDVTVLSGATLGLNRNNITGTLTLNGGTLSHGNGFGATWGGSVVLAANSTFNITGNLNMPAVVSGSGGLTKTGGATLTFTRVNTYAGPTTVTAGVLKCDNVDSLGSGALSVSGTGKVNLSFAGTKAVAGLTLGGVSMTTPGTYGSLTSGALFTSSYLEGTGKLLVGGVESMAYITSFGANVPGSAAVIGTVAGNAATISWVVPPATNLATLAPEFVMSPGATCSNQTSGVIPTPNFSAGPVTYSIVSQNSSVTNVYTVTATVMVPEATVIWNLAGGGTWNTTTFNWLGQVSGQPTLYSEGANVIFNKTTGGTIEIAADTSPLTTTVSAASGTYVFVGGPIDSGSLVKSGGGTLQLLCAANIPPTGLPAVVTHTYPGGTVIDGGTLVLGGLINGITPGVNNPVGTGAVTLNAGTIEFNSNTVSNDLIVNGGTLFNNNGWPSTWSGPVILNNTANLTANYDFAVSGSATGAGGFSKNGNATVTLSGTNDYSGATSVTAGTLRFDNTNAVSGSSAIQLSGTGKLNLNYAGTKVVASLTLGGVAQTTPGTYGSVASGATFANDTYFVGGGTLTIGGPAGFADWAATNAPGQTPGDDYDADGVANGVEYFMGETGSSFTAMPVADASRTVTWTKDPDYSGTWQVQTSPDLGTWTDVAGTDNGTSVSYTLPSGAGKLFVRLLVTPTP